MEKWLVLQEFRTNCALCQTWGVGWVGQTWNCAWARVWEKSVWFGCLPSGRERFKPWP